MNFPASRTTSRSRTGNDRHVARHRRTPGRSGRPRPARLTLGAAAATVVLAAGGVGIAASISPAAGSVPAAGLARASTTSSGHGRVLTPVRARHPQGKPAGRALSSRGRAQRSATPTVSERHRAARARPAKSFLIYDSVIPAAIPANQMVATYATGSVAVPAAQVAGRQHVLWIDVLGIDYAAAALDVEPGDASPSVAAAWVWHKLIGNRNGVAILYTFLQEWPSVKAAVASLPSWMQSRVRWWIADPTGVPHIVPGSEATQWYWGSSYDISTALPGF